MNPSTAGLWNNPPPPGLEDEQDLSHFDRDIKPYNKSPPVAVDHDKKHKDRHGHRRRSRSRSKDRSRRHRSRSKRRHRKTRSHHRHRSRSLSRSISRDRSKHNHKSRRRRSHSKSKRSRSRSRKHHRSSKKSYSRSPTSIKNEPSDYEENRVEEDDETEENKNSFKNDGSFLELYKKLQEEQQKAEQAKLEAQSNEVKKPMFGKRRGGRVLKTGIVAKNKPGEEADGEEPQDPWSIYLKEVKRYKEACCDDDSKTRPLVK